MLLTNAQFECPSFEREYFLLLNFGRRAASLGAQNYDILQARRTLLSAGTRSFR